MALGLFSRATHKGVFSVVHYQVTCAKCKKKRSYEGKTLGDCFDKAHGDGWRPTGKMTERQCNTCGGDKDAETS